MSVAAAGEEAQEVVVSLYAHTAQNDDELSFGAGTRLVVLSRAEREWWRGRSEASGQVGMFPVNYVRPLTAPAGKPGQAPVVSRPPKSCKLLPSLLVSPTGNGWL